MNESLRRALLRARLSEEGVAACLQVDPKTVRRWLEGRMPQARHRWRLASALGLEEADLWPQLAASPWRSGDLQAIYPHLDAVPLDAWIRFFAAARKQIDILTDSYPLQDGVVSAILLNRACAGIKERICLRGSNSMEVAVQALNRSATSNPHDIQVHLEGLHRNENVEIRVHRGNLTNYIYCADDHVLVAQHAFGIAERGEPVLHLRRSSDIAGLYLEGFGRMWASSQTVHTQQPDV